METSVFRSEYRPGDGSEGADDPPSSAPAVPDEGRDRRIAPRRWIGETGAIALDEHTSLGCFIHDLSASGVRITLPGVEAIPEVFVLKASCLASARVCCVVWRGDETICARFRD